MPLLLAERARSEGEAKGMRSFLCSRSARPKKGLARRPQSKASHTLARLSVESGESNRRCPPSRAALATPLKGVQ